MTKGRQVKIILMGGKKNFLLNNWSLKSDSKKIAKLLSNQSIVECIIKIKFGHLAHYDCP